MKLIPFLLPLLMSPAILFGQGQVNFLNNAATPIRTNNTMGMVGLMRESDAFRIGLYIAPAGTVNESLFTLSLVATNSSLVAGRIGAGGGIVDIPGNNGTPIAYQVKAWSLKAGNSYEEAPSKYLSRFPVFVGKSPIGGVTPAIGGAPVPSLFTSTAGVPEFSGQLTSGFDLLLITPEPSTYALAALGILMIFCCGKSLSRKLQ